MLNERTQKSPFLKIHNIHPAFNRIFSVPLYVLSFLALVILVFLPYRGRVLFALLINVFFNRPIVYANYLARWIAQPIGQIWTFLFYFLIVGAFSIIYRIFFAKRIEADNDRWVNVHGQEDPDDLYFQS